MRLLCLSNGHGEDAIALRILLELQQLSPTLEMAALPIAGEGQAYLRHGIPLVGPAKQMPSGGFIYMDGRQLARDLQSGLLRLTLSQLQAVRTWAQQGDGLILAVGDIVPLLFGWWSGAAYAFVGTAKSDYYLRDEQGVLPRQSWFERFESAWGSVYLPWERWLMRQPRCKSVFPRDRLTSVILKRYGIPAFDLGNPMMDGLEPTGIDFQQAVQPEFQSSNVRPLTFVLLPGSRDPEAYQNWQLIMQAVAVLVATFKQQPLLFLGAIAPTLDFGPLRQSLERQGWRDRLAAEPGFPGVTFTQRHAVLVLTSDFNDCLHQADIGIAMAGTATEQFVGLGKPAITMPGLGPQFTTAFAEAQSRLLGPSILFVDRPEGVVGAVQSLLQDPDRLQLIHENGRRRLGEAGAALRIAKSVLAIGSIQ